MADRRYIAELYQLQAASREIVDSRVSACCRVAVPGRVVEIWRSEEERKARFHNVVRCSNLWLCPVCCNAITAHRRDTISKVMSHLKLPCVMITLTMSHDKRDTLHELLTTLGDAWRSLAKGALFKKCKRKSTMVGWVRALEITWGDGTGWHPHYHCLFWFNDWRHVSPFYEAMRTEWQVALVDGGGHCSHEHGCVITHAATTVAEYVAKYGYEPSPDNHDVSDWSLAQEASRGALSKSSSNTRYTPFRLLRNYILDVDAHRALWALLFVQYARAIKGQHQMVWSRGRNLRAEAGCDDTATDSEIVETMGVGYTLLAKISPREWSAIVYCGRQGEVLEWAGRNDLYNLKHTILECVEEYSAYADHIAD